MISIAVDTYQHASCTNEQCQFLTFTYIDINFYMDKVQKILH